ncbi:hypothetical protein BT69DRAFT_1271065 [Atractiella rhizophila]|nr:hypothetical protein BT69DRAFT_1271065 [Atractiella rhizophila]
MKSAAVFVLALTSLIGVEARMRWPERDGRPIVSRIMSRKVGNEHPESLTKLASACDGGTCGTLAGKCVSSLLAAADPCAQQDCADEMIDVALAQTDSAVQQNIINIAIEFRQAEKNTQPDFRVQPPVDRFSIFCLKAPKHEQLNGLVQAQDSNANPLLFADPKSTTNGTTVLKGTARNTEREVATGLPRKLGGSNGHFQTSKGRHRGQGELRQTHRRRRRLQNLRCRRRLHHRWQGLGHNLHN